MIANMVRADLPRVALLASQLGYPTSIAALSDRFDEIEANVEYLLLVARDGDDVLGWAQANVEALTLLADRRVELAAIVVDEKARGKKIGVALLHAVEHWAKEQGATTIAYGPTLPARMRTDFIFARAIRSRRNLMC